MKADEKIRGPTLLLNRSAGGSTEPVSTAIGILRMNFREDEEIVATFIGETRDHLGELEYGILQLEDRSPASNDELMHGMFRAAHSIKAGANLLDLVSIETLSHHLENLLQGLIGREGFVDGQTVTVFLQAIDLLQEMISRLDDSDSFEIAPIVKLLQDVRRL